MGLLWPKVQELARGFAKPHIDGFRPSICLVQIPLQSPPALQDLVSSANLLMEDLIPSSRSPIKTLNRMGPNTDPWGDTISEWPPAGCNTINHQSLGLAVQPVPNPVKNENIQVFTFSRSLLCHRLCWSPGIHSSHPKPPPQPPGRSPGNKWRYLDSLVNDVLGVLNLSWGSNK